MDKPLVPHSLLALDVPGTRLSETALDLPEGLSFEDWFNLGIQLGRAEHSISWWVGDWWNQGRRYGERVDAVQAESWQGPDYHTCRNLGTICSAFAEVSRRRDTLSFTHHAEVASLDPDEADALLDEAEQGNLSAAELRGAIKKKRRQRRERELGERQLELPTKLYGVILADPPWRFEPYSRETGMDRAADNHYPTMTLDDIKALDLPAADDAVLFLWVTVPFAHVAHEVVDVWGFEYVSQFVWMKAKAGTGYWNRNQHELLLVAKRGDIPAPAPGEQFRSVIVAAAGVHSAKPDRTYEIIESYFPTLPKIELFARKARAGWDAWGMEAPAVECKEGG